MTSHVRGGDAPEAPDGPKPFQSIEIPPDAFFSGRADYPYRSPFTEVRWDRETPYVLIDQQWYGYVAIDGVEVERIWSFCRARLDKLAKKRFAEDQLAVLESLGHKVGNAATLKLRSANGDLITLEHDRFLEAYRQGWPKNEWKRYGGDSFDYQTRTDTPGWVRWMCETFHASFIASVELGEVFEDKQGLPSIPYELTLQDGRTLKGILPFEYNAGLSVWYGKEGIDWHRMYPKGLAPKQ